MCCAQTADPNYLDSADNDIQIFNYFLNLEYLLAEFYSCAATGQGIAAAARGGGPASTGCQQATLTGAVAVRGPSRLTSGRTPRSERALTLTSIPTLTRS